MGPESTALLYMYMIRTYQTRYDAFKDADFPEVIIHSIPIPIITNYIENECETKKMLTSSVLFLDREKVDYIVFPCNTLNYFLEHMRSLTKIPIISIVEETCNVIKQNNLKEFMLLSTETTFNTKIYQNILEDTVVKRPDKYNIITSYIHNVLKGKDVRQEFNGTLESLISKNVIVIGCTDISILTTNMTSPKLIDSLKILAEKTVEMSMINHEYNKQR